MQLNVVSRSPAHVTGPAPIVFVHGAWHGAWCWDEHFLPYFADHGWDVHAVDLRAHGESPGRDRLRRTSITDYVADVGSVVDSMDRPPVLVGHSMGGLIVQRYLEEHVLPAGVLMASVPPRGAWRATFRTATHHPLAFAKANLTLNLGPIVGTRTLASDLLFSPATAPDVIDKHHVRLQDESYAAYVGMLLRWPRPDRVVTPILVLGGGDDQVFHPSEVAATAAAYRTSADIFQAMGHDMMLEPEWERVADRIETWLRETL